MNKKGFTLIELLAVVTLIVLISLLAIPKITKNMKSKKTELSETNLKLLSAAADTYIENNQISYEHGYEANGSTYCIPVQELVNDGVLNKPFKTIDGNEIDYSSKVKATYQAQYNSFSYELVDRNSCEEIIQYVNRPDLAENMIPVVYNSESNVWVKADVNSNWYNYSDQNWANAVLVKELKTTAQSKNRGEYIEALPGTPIEDSDILAHFVWIPRYKYKLFTSNTNEEIEIVFERASQPKSTGKNGWLTHPAFTYNNNELPGIWVAKYETSIDNNNILIKNNTPVTNIDYVEANKKTIQMTDENNMYGLKKVNTHMTRNSEWGAITYLTNSIYGDNQNNSTTNNQTGIYNLSGNKEFVIQDNQDENSLGYALNETKNWTTDNSYPTTENLYLTRGNNSIFNYNNSKVIDENTTFRISLTNTETQNQNYQKKYIVTFDPDGGTLSETTKEVSYHEPYGELPTPTREGYTFVGWQKPFINGYYSVEYIESNGSQYIDTGVVPKSTISVEFDFELTSGLNGWGSSGNQEAFSWGKTYKNRLGTVISDNWAEQGVTSEFNNSNRHKFELKSGKQMIDGITFGTSTIGNSASTGQTMYLFAIHVEWSNQPNSYASEKVYSTKIWDGNTIIRNYAPCVRISDGIAGLYDTVNNSFYKSSGTNEFINGDYNKVLSSTTVEQQKNHTLKAIWQANS